MIAQFVMDFFNKVHNKYKEHVEQNEVDEEIHRRHEKVDNAVLEDEKVLRISSEPEDRKIVGKYCKSDRLLVTISAIDAANGVYKWSNENGTSWTLTQYQDSKDKLMVGNDCPYFDSGHKEAKL